MFGRKKKAKAVKFKEEELEENKNLREQNVIGHSIDFSKLDKFTDYANNASLDEQTIRVEAKRQADEKGKPPKPERDLTKWGLFLVMLCIGGAMAFVLIWNVMGYGQLQTDYTTCTAAKIQAQTMLQMLQNHSATINPSGIYG